MSLMADCSLRLGSEPPSPLSLGKGLEGEMLKIWLGSTFGEWGRLMTMSSKLRGESLRKLLKELAFLRKRSWRKN
jgi:hypothetical protein